MQLTNRACSSSSMVLSMSNQQANAQKAKRIYKMVKRRPINNNRQISYRCKKQNIFKEAQYENTFQFENHQLKFVGQVNDNAMQLSKTFKQTNKRKYQSKENIVQSTKDEDFPKINCYKATNQKQITRMTSSGSQIENSGQKQQIYRQNTSYSSKLSSKKDSRFYLTENSFWNLKRSNTQKSKTTKMLSHEKWAQSRIRKYHAHIGYRAQNYFKKPLAERYGNRYFQYHLRDRYKQEPGPPTYVHWIQDDFTRKKSQNNKFIAKIKTINPNLKSYEKMKVKGKKLVRMQPNVFVQ